MTDSDLKNQATQMVKDLRESLKTQGISENGQTFAALLTAAVTQALTMTMLKAPVQCEPHEITTIIKLVLTCIIDGTTKVKNEATEVVH